MSTSNAAEYADALTNDIQERTEAGAPFGWINRETDEWTGDEPEGWTTDEESPWMEASASDYLTDALDIRYIVASDKTYIGAQVCITLGGPTAWINTQTGKLEVTWWSQPEYRTLPSAFIDGLDDALSELWEC